MTVVRVPVRSSVVQWAMRRSGRDQEELEARFPDLPAWESGAKQPTFRQVEAFAAATYTPVGYLFLHEPPDETLPVADMRTLGDEPVAPSADLLDTIYLCQRRQEWYREYALAQGYEPLTFIASVSHDQPAVAVAELIRDRIGFQMDQRGYRTWSDAVLGLAQKLEQAGVLVMISGIVGSNGHRSISPQDFRGFTLADPIAPVIFVNGSDSKGAQSFTLAHEAAHVWLGGSAVSNAPMSEEPPVPLERWCNAVAAELLVPADDLRQHFSPPAPLRSQLDQLTRRYKVSSLVVLRRLLDTGFLSWPAFREAYLVEQARTEATAPAGTGGDFYLTTPVRTSRRLLEAVVRDTVEGRTLYRDAFKLLGFQNQATFDNFARRIGL